MPSTHGFQRRAREIGLCFTHDAEVIDEAIGADATLHDDLSFDLRVTERLRIDGPDIGKRDWRPDVSAGGRRSACGRVACSARRPRRPWKAWRIGKVDRLGHRSDLQLDVLLFVLAGQRHRALKRRKAGRATFEEIVARRQADEFEATRLVTANFMSDNQPVRTAVTIHVPAPLRQYCDGVSDVSVSAPNVRAALEELERNHTSLYRNICDETGTVRRHLNVFVNASHVRDRDGLETALAPGDVVTILAAVSGG